MRRTLLLPLIAAVACSTATPPPPKAPDVVPPTPLALTVEQEAQILSLEDRRAFDPAVADAWTKSPNRLQRERIALAFGRIGPHTFVDANGNGQKDEGELQAGVEQLKVLARDTDPAVRLNTAFSLGEIADPTTMKALFDLAADVNTDVAAEAAEALSKMATEIPFPSYLALTKSGPEAVRVRAIRFLFRFDDGPMGVAATAALDDVSPAVREAAAYALSRRPYASARQRLELLLTDPSILTRAYATAALGRIAAKESVPVLVQMLGDAQPWVRTNAALALTRIVSKDLAALSPDHLPRIFATLEDADAGTRASTIDLLGWYASKNESAKQRLFDILTNGTRWERELAAGAVARHFPIKDLPAELTAVQKVRVLENVKNWGAELRSRWIDDADPMVRANAVGSIPDSEVTAEMPVIAAGLKDSDVIVRANAIERLTKSASAKGELVGLLMGYERAERTSEMNDARISALAGLAELTWDGRQNFWRDLLQDSDPVVRRIASDTMAKQPGLKRPQYTPLAVRPVDYVEVARWARQPHTATIRLPRGDVKLTLLASEAPMTAWNFAQLAKKGYFDNTSFMRVVPNFVVQGGDPRNDMNGGPGYAIRDEINLEKYTRGAVGMALSGPDTGGSQFFITHSPQPHLDGGYTIFGRVIEGMSGVVDQIERGDKVETISVAP